MIEIRNLTKRYGSFLAVDDISFEVEKGKILGFLGPIGAGKRRIGYMPETPPLYVDMTVEEYLNFAARLKQLPAKEVKGAMELACEKVDLNNVLSKVIKALSKGYKQRVGLAQAIIHDPEVLILDEPTIGLDPIQIREVRELIRSLAGEHTIILSTHILPEVDMICDEVVIIQNG